MKQTGKRSAGKPHAAFDVAGAGNVAMVVGMRSIAKAMELPPTPTVRAPALDPTCESLGVQIPGATLLFICARSRQGKFTVHVKTIDKRLHRGLKAIADWCKEHRHDPVDKQQQALNAKLRSHYQYYGRRTNYASVYRFYLEVCGIWKKWLNRRTRGNAMTWKKFRDILRENPLLKPRIMHA